MNFDEIKKAGEKLHYAQELEKRLPSIIKRIEDNPGLVSMDDLDNLQHLPMVRTKRDLKAFDKISFIVKHENKNCELFNTFMLDPKIPTELSISKFRPFLDEGVISWIANTGSKTDMYFKLLDYDEENEIMDIHMDIYSGGWFETTMDVRYHELRSCSSSFITAEDIYAACHKAGILTNVEKENYEQLFGTDGYSKDNPERRASAEKNAQYYAGKFLSTFYILNQIIEDSYKESDSSETIGKTIRVEKKNRITGKRNVIFLGGAHMSCTPNTKLKFKNGVIARHTLAWGVRGHFRHHKDGRISYIRPYEKGPERNKGLKKPKNYAPMEVKNDSQDI